MFGMERITFDEDIQAVLALIRMLIRMLVRHQLAIS